MREVVEVEPALALLGSNDLAHTIREARLAVCGQTHHFVFIAVLGETEELRERCVKDPEGVGKQDGALDPDLAALAEAPHDAAEVAEPVNGDDGGVLEGRCEEGAGEAGAVVLDEVEVGGIFGGNSFRSKRVGDRAMRTGLLVAPEEPFCDLAFFGAILIFAGPYKSTNTRILFQGLCLGFESRHPVGNEARRAHRGSVLTLHLEPDS